jgi:hypothetical protein
MCRAWSALREEHLPESLRRVGKADHHRDDAGEPAEKEREADGVGAGKGAVGGGRGRGA